MSFQDYQWLANYSTLEHKPLQEFYIPALERAVRYDRISAYFSARALFYASRGIRSFVERNGKMRLLLSCELSEKDVGAIEKGYDLRQQIEDKLVAIPLALPDLEKREGLLALTYMISRGTLDIRIAVRLLEQEGRLVHDSFSIMHDKLGILYDNAENTISFRGSNNESAAGWINNSESFSVQLSWEGQRELERIQYDISFFEKRWNGEIAGLQVFEFPDALREKLIHAYPPAEYEALLGGGNKNITAMPGTGEEPPEPPITPEPAPDPVDPIIIEKRRSDLWRLIRNAASLPDGLSVGYQTAAVSPWPHQLRNLKRMAEPESIRILVCDEVGLGKTITAGLAIRQLYLAKKANRILILVPAGVIPQWQNELYEKFNLNVPVYNGKELLYKPTHGTGYPPIKTVSRTDWMQEAIVIASSHLVRRKDRQKDFQEALNWDLILLDEAHHARRTGAGSTMEKGPNTLLQLLDQLKSKTKSLILATATPMQIHPVEVWDLLNILGLPVEWDRSAFEEYFTLLNSKNPSDAELSRLAALFRATEKFYGAVEQKLIETILPEPEASHIGRITIIEALRSEKGTLKIKRLSAKERKQAVRILQATSPVQRLMARHTRLLLKEYYKKGLIKNRIAERKVHDIAIEMPAKERMLYEMVESYISEVYNKAPDSIRSSVGFVMTIYRKRLASSYLALYRTLEKRLQKAGFELADLSGDDIDDDQQNTLEDRNILVNLENKPMASMLPEELQRIKEIMKECSRLATSQKSVELESIIQASIADGYESVIIFTQYTDTLDYLKEFLAERSQSYVNSLGTYFGGGGQIKIGQSDWKNKTREQIKEEFIKGNIQLLICTDAAAEGLNLQSCGVLINYDLPWNPMKVEQRIGRIDRIGQKYDEMQIYNLAYKDTVEFDIYFSLAQKIHLFQGVVGKLQPILSLLPEKIEELAMLSKEERELTRESLFHELERQQRELESDSFDIDAVSREALEIPEIPESKVSLQFLEKVMNHPDKRPSQIEWAKLDPGSYDIAIPGFDKKRVTFSPERFEFHNSNMDLFSHGNTLFDAMLDMVPE
ncbi:MAG: DEAD/DEAH box helicase family protein [Leptospiraceae bacterium]|nr:DEAD/DEAH box helicase family protein [Leptospiraceae bacterium]